MVPQKAVQEVYSHPTTRGVTTQLRDIRKVLPLRVLSPADWNHWTSKGYVIVRQRFRRVTYGGWSISFGRSMRKTPTTVRPGTRRNAASTG